MKPFAIDIKNSGKGERKKAVAWLRSQGHTVRKRKNEEVYPLNFLYSRSMWVHITPKYDFEYHSLKPIDKNVEILTLPEDDAKFREYTCREEQVKTDTEERITHKLIHQEAVKFVNEINDTFTGVGMFKMGMYRALELIGYKINKK